MGGFKAREVVSALEYDFAGIKANTPEDQELLDAARGVTPEPSTMQVRRMNTRQKALLGLPADATVKDTLDALATKSEEELLEIDEEQLDIVADITSGEPSRDELAALPWRHRQGYYGWLLGELNNPSVGTASTRRSVVPLKSATS